MPMVITDGLSAAGMVVRDGQSDFRSTHPSVEPHRGGCRPRSAGCQRANPTGGKSTTSQSTGTLDATGCRPHVLTAIQQVRALPGSPETTPAASALVRRLVLVGGGRAARR